jgi:hypothetical protein
MINITLTGITHNTYTTTTDIPFAINDTFYCDSNISFVCTASGILDILSKTINSGNITNFALYYRLIDNTTSNTIILSDTIDLTAAMFVNNSIIVSLDDLNNTITHDYVLDDMSEDEFYQFYKKYILIIRIYEKSTAEETAHLANLNTILATDIVQDLNYALNGIYQGPYDVGFDLIDLLHKNDFTLEEIKEIYNAFPTLFGFEKIFCWYPKNISNNKSPVLFFQHGAGQIPVDYSYLFSTLASYGYVCFGICYPPYDTPAGSTDTCNHALLLINHIKNNTDKILSGFFDNIIDFNKINVIGHSRGGGIMNKIPEYVKSKNYLSFPYNSINIEYDDIKSMISIAAAGLGHILNNGLLFGMPIPAVNYQQLNSDFLDQNFTFNYIPKLILNPARDSDVGLGEDITSSYQQGFCFDTKRNITETITLNIENIDHDDFGISLHLNENSGALIRYYATPANEISLNSDMYPKFAKRNEETYYYNSRFMKLKYLKRDILNFLNIHNFNCNKLKKIRFFNRTELHNYDPKFSKNILYNAIKYPESNIDFYIDDYQSLVSSLAGSTGATLINANSITYNYCQDYKSLDLDHIGWNIGSNFLNKILNKEIPNFTLDYRSLQGFHPTNKSFNQFHTTTYKGLEFEIDNQNVFLGYSFTNPIELNNDSYILLKGGLTDQAKYELSGGISYFCQLTNLGSTSGNTFDCSFTMSLYDINNNISSLSSNLYNYGFRKNRTSTTDENFKFNDTDHLRCIIEQNYFRAGDFYLKNPNLDLANINQILLSFGPSYGSTHCTVGLDEFFVLQNF